MPESPDRSALIQLTRSLIDIPSVSRNESALLTRLLDLIPSSWTLAYEGDAVALLTMGPRSDRPFVVIAGHTDTVPIANNVPSRQVDDTIYGRGACDMKGALAVMVTAANTIADVAAAGKQMDFDIGLLFFGREELPPTESALIPALEACEDLRTADFAILMEPTINALELGCQGNLNLTLHVAGTASHSARPWAGSNAAHTAIVALQELASASPNDVVIDGLTFREVANVTAIRGGIARNVIPDAVEVDINIRYAPTRSAREAEAMWTERLSADNITVELIGNAAPAPVVRGHQLAQRLLDAGAGDPMPKQAWTNAADFAAYGIPAVNLGPGDPAFAHRDDEQVTGESLEQSARVLVDFLFPKSGAEHS